MLVKLLKNHRFGFATIRTLDELIDAGVCPCHTRAVAAHLRNAENGQINKSQKA